MNILITGATGIIGGAVARQLVTLPDMSLRAAVRQVDDRLPEAIRQIADCELAAGIDSDAAWDTALSGIDCVIHCAARVHQMKDRAADPAAEFQRINTQATLDLAGRAAKAGVKRFVFLSTVMVHGTATALGRPFTAEDWPQPQTPYAQSKWDAEIGLREIAAHQGLEIVVIRPPMVYGPNAKGNFLALAKVIQKGLPLPFGAVQNQRSLVGIDNLVSMIALAATHPSAANQTFLVSDDEDVSTPELICLIASAIGKPPVLLPIPVALMEWGARLLGRKALAQRLLGSLQVDISKTKSLLGWQPIISVAEGIRRALHAA